MDRAARRGYSGTGPGAITPDGCAVEVYERLPVLDEPDVIEGAVPAGAAVLELGSGTGRITHPLVRRGFSVTAVDESPQMLESHRRTDRGSSIESLDLGSRFDVGCWRPSSPRGRSAGAPAAAGDVPAACRGRRVRPDPAEAQGGTRICRRSGRSPEASCGWSRPSSLTGVRSVHVEYVFPDPADADVPVLPAQRRGVRVRTTQAGLAVDTFLTEDRTWVRALPVTS